MVMASGHHGPLLLMLLIALPSGLFAIDVADWSAVIGVCC
jgi:hypothetical protein